MMDPLQEVRVFNGLGFSTSAIGSIPFHSISVSLFLVFSHLLQFLADSNNFKGRVG